MQFDIYCDESRQDLLASLKSVTRTNRYSCIGGLMVPSTDREVIKDKIKELMVRHQVFGEVKWGTVTPSKKRFFLDLVDLFFYYSSLQFRVVVIDATKINHSLYNANDQELGYYKFYYQLLAHWIDATSSYRVFTDQKTNRDKRRLSELKRITNRKYGHASIQSIQSIDSSESIILQLQNVLMGAVGYKYNYQNYGASEAKKDVVERIEYHLGHPILRTTSSEYKFNVFEIALREDV